MQYTHTTRPDGKIGLMIDLGSITIPELQDKEALLSFPIGTYTKVCRTANDDNDETSFRSINNFFDFINIDDRKIIAIYLIMMHLRIREKIGSGQMDNISELTNILSDMVLALDKRISLYQKMVEFSDQKIPINIPKNAGLRPQDNKETTYLYNDVVHLLACIMIAKLFAPIFGTIMYYTSMYDVESKLKEMHCLPIVSRLYNSVCPEVVHKLKNYINRILNKEFKKLFDRDDSINMGLTKNTISMQVYVNLVVRNFINIDIFRKDSNHITALHVGIKKAIGTQHSSVKKHHIDVRKDIASLTDDQQRSQLEIDSIISTNTSDVAIIAQSHIDKVITTLLKEYGIDRSLYEECYTHNLGTHVPFHVLNKLLVEMVFSIPLSGVSSLSYLKIDSITKMISVVQIMAISRGYVEAGCALSAVPGTIIKGDTTDNDQRILIGYNIKRNYRAYQTKLSESSMNPELLSQFFDQRIREIVMSITTQSYLHNVSQGLCSTFNLNPDVNGKQIVFTEEYIDQICAFMGLMWPI